MSRRAAGRTGAGTRRQRRTIWCCWRQPGGLPQLIKLVSAGYTEGFYYKPRMTSSCSRSMPKGLIGLSSCLKGEWPKGSRTLKSARRWKRRRPTGTFSARTTSSSRCSGTAIEEQAAVKQRDFRRSRAISAAEVCTNDVHYLRETDAHAHRHPAVHRTAKGFSDPKRLRYDANSSS